MVRGRSARILTRRSCWRPNLRSPAAATRAGVGTSFDVRTCLPGRGPAVRRFPFARIWGSPLPSPLVLIERSARFCKRVAVGPSLWRLVGGAAGESPWRFARGTGCYS